MLCQAARRARKLVPSNRARLWNLSDSLAFLGLQKAEPFVDVYAIDPRTVLQPELLQSTDLSSAAALLKVPRELLHHLSKGVAELADMDEPGNAWYFGERAEIFDYTLVGEFPTRSGFASFVPREALEQLRKSGAEAAAAPSSPADGTAATAGGSTHPGLASWDEFLQLTSDQVTWPHRKMPFLFAGRMVEASMAAIYTLEREGNMTGVLISSESSGGGGD